MNLDKKFTQTIQQIFAKKFPKRIAVAVSGGVDSMALVFLLKKVCEQKKSELFALTIDHKMRSDSGVEAKSVAKIMKKNSFAHFILQSYLDKAPETNIEASLREMRYNLLSEFCSKNNIEYLFIGHHGGDVAENFLIRLFRGSGIDGLSALDYISDFKDLKLVRPLLDFEKSELEKYLSAQKIRWFSDESNQDEKYLRNKIRKFLNDLPESKLISSRIASAAKSMLESRKLIEEMMIKKSSNILEFSNLGYFLLNLKNFKNLSEQEAKRYLAWMLMDIGGNFYKPRLKDLENLYQWVLKDKTHKPRSFYGCITEKYNADKLIIYREKSKIKAVKLENDLLWDKRFLMEFSYSSSQRKLGSRSASGDPSLRWDDEGKGWDDEVGNGELLVDTINQSELNQLIKQSPKLKNLKNPLKKIYCTLPVLRKNNKIIATAWDKFPGKIIFKPQTKLVKNENCTLPN